MQAKNRPITVAHLISGLKRGGRERQLCVLVSHSRTTEVRHEILCLNRDQANYVDEYGLQNRIRYFKSSSKAGRLAELCRLVRRVRPDAVFAWGSHEYLYAAVCRMVMNRFVLVNGSIRHGIRLRNFSQTLRMLLLKMSAQVVANSEAGLRANRLLRSPRHHVLYNGIEDKFVGGCAHTADRIRQTLAIPEDAAVFVSVANFVPYKDYHTTLHALKLLSDRRPDCHFIFIGLGTGPMRNEIENMATRLGLGSRVRLIGPVDNVEDYLSIGDLFIHSSMGEGCSNAILEAMAAGLPVIATKTGGTPEIIQPPYGQLFPYKNAEALCRSIERVVFKGNLQEMKATARETAASRFSAEAMKTNFHDILFSILSKNSGKKKWN